MRALITRDDTVTFADVADPTPRADQAVIAVEAISLNRGEISALASTKPGVVWGWDAAGTVRTPAADGSGPPAGARVVGMTVPAGAWAELAAISTSRLGVLAADVSAEAAATLPVAGLTALYALDVSGGVLGRRVLVTGATGGVGRFAIQLARRGGAEHITALVRDPGGSSDLIGLGADDLVAEIPRDGPMEDVIVESLGGPTMAQAIKRVAPAGILVTLGDTSREPVTIGAFDLYPNGARIQALRVFTEVDRRGTGARDLAYLSSGVSDGWLVPSIDRVATWDHAPAIIQALRSREIHGKAVLTVG